MIFSGGVAGAAPLMLQLKTPASTWARLRMAAAGGEATTGSCSRPNLSYPSTIGTASTTVTPRSLSPGWTALCELGSQFSLSPSTPGGSSFSGNLPFYFHFQAAPGTGLLVEPSSALLFYASASGGHTWTGYLEWEEV